MTISGFQDFQEGTIWQSDLAFNFNASIAPSGVHTWPDTGSPTVVCSNWQATQLHVSTIASLDVIVRWWNVSNATFPLGERRFSHKGTWADTYLNLPNLGPYMNFTVIKDAVGTTSVTLTGVFTNRPIGPFCPPSSGPMIDFTGQNVAPFGGIDMSAAYLYAGNAYLDLWTDSTSYIITVQGRRADNSTVRVAQFDASDSTGVARHHQLIVVPPLPIEIELFNNMGVAHNFDGHLTGDLFR